MGNALLDGCSLEALKALEAEADVGARVLQEQLGLGSRRGAIEVGVRLRVC